MENKIEQLLSAGMLKDYPDVVDISQLCDILKIGKNKAYQLIKQRKIKSLAIGKKIVIPKYNILAFMLMQAE